MTSRVNSYEKIFIYKLIVRAFPSGYFKPQKWKIDNIIQVFQKNDNKYTQKPCIRQPILQSKKKKKKLIN